MIRELSHGEWSAGNTSISVVDASELEDCNPTKSEIGYRFQSFNENDADSPAVDFSAEELREVIDRCREFLSSDPFEDGDFDPVVAAFDEHGDGVVLGHTGSKDSVRKEFKAKWHDDGQNVYLKIQKFKNGSNLRKSPTMGPNEFKEIFGNIVIL